MYLIYLRKAIIIGGPGQGKSTLGQQVAQVYRAKWLGRSYDFAEQIKVKRIPVRVVLKYFAQWLANKPNSESSEFPLTDLNATLFLCGVNC